MIAASDAIRIGLGVKLDKARRRSDVDKMAEVVLSRSLPARGARSGAARAALNPE